MSYLSAGDSVAGVVAQEVDVDLAPGRSLGLSVVLLLLVVLGGLGLVGHRDLLVAGFAGVYQRARAGRMHAQ